MTISAPATPGPWFVDRRRDRAENELCILAMQGGETVEVCSIIVEGKISDEDRANAKLICEAWALRDAALDLYKAVQNINDRKLDSEALEESVARFVKEMQELSWRLA